MTRVFMLGLISLLLSACTTLLPPPISRFEQQTPRPFGYVIGDQIRHRLVVETRKDVRLIRDSLPKPGPVNRWLQLNELQLSSGDSGEITIDLQYQVFYAANEVKLLAVPGFDLRFMQAGKTVSQPVSAWSFTLSPLQGLPGRKAENSLDYLRPDAWPEPLSNQRHWLALYAGLSLALLSGVYLLYGYGFFPAWPQQRIFKRAELELSQLAGRNLPRSLAVLHQAFNSLHGQPLFKHRLADFFKTHGQYQTAAPQINWFFDYSNAVLFAGKADVSEQDWRNLLDLCHLCREIERGSR